MTIDEGQCYVKSLVCVIGCLACQASSASSKRAIEPMNLRSIASSLVCYADTVNEHLLSIQRHVFFLSTFNFISLIHRDVLQTPSNSTDSSIVVLNAIESF